MKKINIILIIFITILLSLTFLETTGESNIQNDYIDNPQITPYNYNNNYNSQKLSFIMPTNDDQAYHPKIIAFDNKWNDYKYWIAFTPYPYSDSKYENPVVNSSNDLINWNDPDGNNVALDEPEINDREHYNSDTHLLYNYDFDRLELFWRYVNDKDNEVIIYYMYSYDGKEWSDKSIFLESNDRKNLDYVSPAIIYEDGIYKIWYVDNKEIYYIEKTSDNELSDFRKINVMYDNGYKSWHIDVIYNDTKKIYEMITCAYENIDYRKEMNLYYSYSTDNIEWSNAIMILAPSAEENAWDSQGLYRSTLLYENNTYYLLYSGHDKNGEVGIGIMYGDKITNLKPLI